ncbi:MAG: threonine-phosphate decarboxylase [Geobacteraceae bacterium]|nr:threonine-phosphate decarboxylase [Geobacteraceae bacterium]NTW79624.1 threonine-phosphate decarboxylase [Geobacteraceae bacterium]
MSRSYDHGGNIFTVARTLGVAPEQILDFSASINPLGMSSTVRKALVNSVDSLIHYPDTSHSDLKLALAKFHDLPATHFTIANGSTELIYNLPAMLSGRKALIISPSFSEYVRALHQHHWEVQHFVLTPESGFAIDMDKLEPVLAAGVDLLFICNPGNPNGTLYPQRVIEQIHTLCQSSGTFLVLDEAFMDFSEETSAKRMVIQGDNAVVLRSMTKFFGIPGLRLGYAISNPSLAEQLDAMGGPWSVNTLALAAGMAAIQDAQHNKESLDYVQRERCILLDGLEQFPQFKVYPSTANYLLVEIKGGMTSLELKEQLLLQRILIRDCASFMGLTEYFFRIAVRTSDENKRLLECLGRILK